MRSTQRIAAEGVSVSDEHRYMRAEADEQVERERLRNLEAWLDPITARHLEATGVAVGWRCLEVGAGGGSIAALARRARRNNRIGAGN